MDYDVGIVKQRRIISPSNSYFSVSPAADVIAQGVHFDGSTYFTKASALSGVSAAGVGLTSFWFKMGGTDSASQVFYDLRQGGPSLAFAIFRDSDNTIGILGRNTSGVTVLSLKSTSTNNTSAMTGYFHCIASWDLSVPTGLMYIDGSPVTNFTGTIGEAIDYAGVGGGGFADLGIGAVGDGTVKLTADVADFYINFTTYYDLTNATLRQKFRSAGGNAVDLGTNGQIPTGSSPAFFLHAVNPSGVSTWGTGNKGTGGDFTTGAGALTAAATNPP